MTESDEQIELCGKCGQAKSGSGRLTQWIKVCSCFSVPENDRDDTEIELKVCSACGKRMASGRAGSFTQWVFRSDSCSCNKPQALPNGSDTAVGDTGLRKNSSLKTKVLDYRSKEIGQSETFIDTVEQQRLAELYANRIPAERYRVIREIGKGAAGTVILCRDLLLKKNVAIKSLNVLGRSSLLAFQQEAKATSKLSHPNIVQVIDFGTTASGSPYMVLEYFNGLSLERYLNQYGSTSVDLTLEVLSQVLDALIYAHSQRIWHRDLKPSNILIAERGSDIEVRLIDFGIAAFTQAGVDADNEQSPINEVQHKTLAGTPAYMSPDQALGRPYDARSEIYSLGCVLFELLTGKPPFLGATALETISLHGHAPLPSLTDTMGDTMELEPALLAALESVITTCLAKDPKDRYQSVAQLKQALTRCSGELQDIQESLSPDLQETPNDGTTPLSAKKDNSVFLLIALAAVAVIPLIMFVPFLIKEEGVNSSHAESPKAKSFLDDGTDQGQQSGDLVLRVGSHTWNAFVDGNTKRVLKNIKKRKTMENLWLSTTVDETLIDYVGTLKLDGLAFDDTTFVNMDKVIAKVAKMKSLILLVFSQTHMTDFNLEQISTMKNLQFLCVESAGITDKGISKLTGLPELTGISLSGLRQVTDKTIDIILSMPKLIAVSVAQTGITADGAVRLIQSGRLIGISLGGIPLTATVLNALKESKIERLSLMHSPIDDQTLKCLAAMKHLKSCDLRCSPTVNAGTVSRLQKLRSEAGLPRFKISFGNDSMARDWDVMVED